MFSIRSKSVLLGIGMVAVYLILVIGVIIAQVDRSIDELSFSRSYLVSQSLAKLLTHNGENPSAPINNLELTSKVERSLLDNPEISVVLIRQPDGVVLTKTGSEDIIESIDAAWDQRALRHFALQGPNHPFITRAYGVEISAVAAQNSSNETTAIIWMVRRREVAQQALIAAFNAISHTTLVFILPCFLLVTFCFWYGIKWHFRDKLNIENAINTNQTSEPTGEQR